VKNRGSNIRKRIILPTLFVGGPRDMQKRYTVVMTLAQKFSKIDIFLIMTYNLNWNKIKMNYIPEKKYRIDLILWLESSNQNLNN